MWWRGWHYEHPQVGMAGLGCLMQIEADVLSGGW